MSNAGINISGYVYANAASNASHEYLFPALARVLESISWGSERRIFELGCGNGAVANMLTASGYVVTGVDASTDGIANANRAFPQIKFELGSAYDDLAARFGKFPVVTSLEVVEHLYSPRAYAKTLCDLLLPGGTAIVSTPYHGYLKNLALAASGKLDSHFTALWDHGHIKFWSRRTLTRLLNEVGLEVVDFIRVGRLPPFANSMILVARKSA